MTPEDDALKCSYEDVKIPRASSKNSIYRTLRYAL